MAVQIYLLEKVYMSPSSIHGYVVFAKSKIGKRDHRRMHSYRTDPSCKQIMLARTRELSIYVA